VIESNVTLTEITPSTGASETEKETKAEVGAGGCVGGGVGIEELSDEPPPPHEDKIMLANKGMIVLLSVVIFVTFSFLKL